MAEIKEKQVNAVKTQSANATFEETNVAPVATLSSTRKEKFWRAFKKEYSNWLFMAPFIIGFSVFMLYPLIASLCYSFTDMKLAGDYTQIGFMNFQKIFDFSQVAQNGYMIWHSIGITVLWAVVSIPISMVLAYTLALALQKNIPGIKVLRLLFYLPVLIPGIVGGQIWTDILAFGSGKAQELGIINQWLHDLGFLPQTFYSHADTQFWTLLGVGLFGVGGGMIVWLAALENVPKTLYEAADIDGAKYFTKLVKITLPMSTPIIFYNLIGAVIGSLQMFDSYSYIGQGLPDKNGYYSTNWIAIQIYMTAFEDGYGNNIGYACSMAWMLFVIIGILTVIMFKSSKWVFYGDSK